MGRSSVGMDSLASAVGSANPNESLFDSVKYRPPRIPHGAVVRIGLAARLAESDHTTLTTVVSAAGYGKTTALAFHFVRLEELGYRLAWVRLAEIDADPQHFLESVFSAFEHWKPGLCTQALSILMNGGAATVDRAISHFFDRVASMGKRCCLFLDDYHRAESPGTNAVISRLTAAAPDNLSIKLASRCLPAIDFSPLRLSAKISEISTNAFLFTRSETEQLFGRDTALPLSSEQHRMIEHFASGWAVGLQALHISARQRDGLAPVLARLADSNADIFHFFSTEVVGGLSQELQWFLSASAKLGVFNAELCNDVFRIDNSAEFIAEIERMNLFFQPVGNQQDWLTYHDLFSEFLSRRDPILEPERQSEINRAAYDWFAVRNMHDFAIPFAIREQMWAEAAEGLEVGWRKMLTLSQFRALENLITRLPPEKLSARPMLQIALAWSYGMQRKLAQAKQIVAEVERKLPLPSIPTVPKDPPRAALFALKASISNMCGDVDSILALTEIDQGRFDAFAPFERSIILNCAVYAHVIAGKIDQAHRLANVGAEALSKAELPLIAIHRELFRGMAYEVSGDLNAAFEAWSYAHELALASFGFAYAPTQSMMASIHLERGDLISARASLQWANAGLNEPAIIRPLILNCLTSARIEVLEGQLTKALHLLGVGEEVGRKEGNVELRVACLSERMRVLVDSGRIAEAHQVESDMDLLLEADKVHEDLAWVGAFSWAALGKAHITVALGKAEEANRIVGHQLLRIDGTSSNGSLISFLLYGTIASYDLNHRQEALQRFARAVAIARQGGYLLTVANIMKSRPEVLADGLNWCARQGEDVEFLVRIAKISNLPRGIWIQFDKDIVEFGAVELTERERDLLWLLGRGESNKQIARDLAISGNTVSWHLKNIFVKLGVENRTQAVKAAQQLGLMK